MYSITRNMFHANQSILSAKELGLQDDHIEMVRKAGLLHDIGKLGIPEIINKCNSLRNVVPIVLHHHEQFDGKGYTGNLKEQDIPIKSRIITFSDAVEVMATDSLYRNGSGPQAILEEI